MDENTNNPNVKWYVVHTASGHEARISETLRQRVETMSLSDRVFELLVPTQDRIVVRGGRKATIKEKILPGYLLVKMILDDNTWLAVRTTVGVTGFVGAGNTPTPLSEKEVENIQKFISAPAKRFKTRFIDYGDRRMTEVLKGYVSQALFFHITGNPFCEKRYCRLFNSHWQEGLIHSQVKVGKFCRHHKKQLCILQFSKH